MHFFIGAIIHKHIDKADRIEHIEKIMEPYSREFETDIHKNYLKEWAIKTLCKNSKIKELDTNNPMQVAKIVMNIPDWYGEDKGAGFDEHGFYCWSARNLNATWDWYCIGGRWNGLIINEPRDDDKGGFNFDDKFQTLEENCSDFDEYVNICSREPNIKCFAYLTPDGAWHKGKDFKLISVEDTEEIFTEYKGKGFDIIGLDCHN